MSSITPVSFGSSPCGSNGQAETFKRAREERGRRDIEAVFDEYLKWIEDTMTTEPQPYITVVCVMTGAPTGRGR